MGVTEPLSLLSPHRGSACLGELLFLSNFLCDCREKNRRISWSFQVRVNDQNEALERLRLSCPVSGIHVSGEAFVVESSRIIALTAQALLSSHEDLC